MCTLLVGRKGPTKLQYLQTEKKKDIIYDSSQKCWKIWILKKTSHQFNELQYSEDKNVYISFLIQKSESTKYAQDDELMT